MGTERHVGGGQLPPFNVCGERFSGTERHVGDGQLPPFNVCGGGAEDGVFGHGFGNNVGCRIGVFKATGSFCGKSNSRFSNKEPPVRPKKFGRLFGGKGRITPKKSGGGWR